MIMKIGIGREAGGSSVVDNVGIHQLHCKICNDYFNGEMHRSRMALKDDDMEVLERKYAMYLLLAVSEHPMSTKTEIMRLQQQNERTKFNRINELIALGLIEYARSENYSRERIILSKDGEELVKIIKKARTVLRRVQRKTDESDERSILGVGP